MRKLLGLLMVVMMVVSIMAINVSALGVDIESLPNPDSDADLVSTGQCSESGGEMVFNAPEHSEYSVMYTGETPYKVITYRSGTGKYYCGAMEHIPADPYGAEAFDDYTLKEFNTFEEAVAAAEVSNYGGSFYTVLEWDATAVFVDPVSSQAKFKCAVAALPNYAKDVQYGTTPVTGDLTPQLSVSLVEKIMSGEDVIGVKLKFEYSLPGYAVFGSVVEEKALRYYVDGVLQRKDIATQNSSGTLDIELSGVPNGVYDFCLETDGGHCYKVSYTLKDITSIMPKPYAGSDDAPTITVLDLPEEAESPLTVTLVSNMPVQWSWNGIVSDGLSMEFSVAVPENGTYSYIAVSEIGKLTEGSVVIDCIQGYSVNAMPLEMVDGTLVQTGVFGGEFNFVLVGVVALGLIGVGVVFYKKGGIRK